jgi:hypothetical protein
MLIDRELQLLLVVRVHQAVGIMGTISYEGQTGQSKEQSSRQARRLLMMTDSCLLTPFAANKEVSRSSHMHRQPIISLSSRPCERGEVSRTNFSRTLYESDTRLRCKYITRMRWFTTSIDFPSSRSLEARGVSTSFGGCHSSLLYVLSHRCTFPR